MELDIIVPAMRRAGTQRLLDSLAAQTRRPDCVTLVSNELQPADLDWHGLAGRIIAFRSDVYAVGASDVALRGNVGIWSSRGTHLLLAADDQVAPRGMIVAWVELLVGRPFAWGHHRLYDGAPRVAELLDRDLATGASREQGVNCWHGYWSAYSGSFGAEVDYLRRAGGIDMLFHGRHAGEDQNLGYRLGLRHRDGPRVFIHEPPAWWHPPFDADAAEPYPAPGWSNVCVGSHAMTTTPIGRGRLQRCSACPYWRYDGDDPQQPEPLIRFDPAAVQVAWEHVT